LGRRRRIALRRRRRIARRRRRRHRLRHRRRWCRCNWRRRRCRRQIVPALHAEALIAFQLRPTLAAEYCHTFSSSSSVVPWSSFPGSSVPVFLTLDT
jgi:hypothetical protein